MVTLFLLLFFCVDINNLKNDNFQVREQSYNKLMKYRYLSYPFLTADFKDVEQKYRAKRIVSTIIKFDSFPCISTSFLLFSSEKKSEHIAYTENYVLVLVPKWLFCIYPKNLKEVHQSAYAPMYFVQKKALSKTTKIVYVILSCLKVPDIILIETMNRMFYIELEVGL